MAGCATQQKGPAYGHEQEFRRQLEKSRAVTYYEDKIQKVTFSKDYQRALVVFVRKGQPTMRSEVILEHIGFGRYYGTLYLTATGFKEDDDSQQTIIRIAIPQE